MRRTDVIWLLAVVVILVVSATPFGASATKEQDLYEEYKILTTMIQMVLDNYVEEVDPKTIFAGAYNGVASALDPYTQYLPPELTEELNIDTKGEFGGLGIEITLDERSILTVITPLEGTPAFKAGVRAGDRIIAIEGKSTKGITLLGAVTKLRGKKGTKVTITVVHESSERKDITIVRDIIKIQSIRGAGIVDEQAKIGYIRVTQFQQGTIRDMDATVSDLSKQGMKALVLDLRFNPGGLLETAVEMADRFLADGLIVYTKGRVQDSSEEFFASKRGTYAGFPLAVLVTHRSASASEIVAGAIKDHKRGIIVGSRTFGKGSVQKVLRLPDHRSSLKLTTAKYYTPSGRSIHRNMNDPDQKDWGIDPDIPVEMTPEQELRLLQRWREQKVIRPPEEGGNDKEPPAEGGNEDQGALDELLKKDGPDSEPEPGEEQKAFVDAQLDAAVNALRAMLIYKRWKEE